MSKSVLGVGVYVQSSDGSLLLGRRTDGQGYCVPGGKVNVGETPADAARREFEEEVGVSVTLTGVISDAVYSKAEVNGRQVSTESTIFSGIANGCPVDSDELVDVRYYSVAEVSAMYAEGELFPPTAKAIETTDLRLAYIPQTEVQIGDILVLPAQHFQAVLSGTEIAVNTPFRAMVDSRRRLRGMDGGMQGKILPPQPDLTLDGYNCENLAKEVLRMLKREYDFRDHLEGYELTEQEVIDAIADVLSDIL